jgi:DNA polymerase I
MEKKKLLLIDTNSIIHRAFHALPPLKNKKGEPSGAVYGSLLAFFKIIEDTKPHYVVAAFDSPGKTFRHKKFKEYKANRPKAPDDLILQIKRTQEVFAKMGIHVLAEEGLEADDIVGSISCSVPEEIETVIATGDADILQLVNEKTKVYTLRRGVKDVVLYDEEKVKERYGGLPPTKIVDIKALQGDSSDNIPGVAGIGEKTAITLIGRFGSIEALYEALEKEEDNNISPKIKEKLLKDKEKAFLSKELAKIDKNGFPGVKINDFSFSLDDERVGKTLEEVGFKSLMKRFPNKTEKEEEEQNNLKLF